MASPLPRERNERSSLPTIFLITGAAVMLGIAFTAVAYFMSGELGSSKTDVAANQIRTTLTSACNAYKLKNGDWPDDLQALLDQGERGGPFVDSADALRDPWGNVYHYDFHGPLNDGIKPDIWAIDPTTGDKIGNWPRR